VATQSGASSSLTPLISAGGALLGVIIGGLLNWLIQRAAERRRQRVLVRAGVRLVDVELRESKSNLERADTGYWPPGLTLSTDAWRTYREALAVTLKQHDWEVLSEAVAALDHLNAGLAKLPVGTGPQGAELPEQLTNEIARTRELLVSALESCERLRRSKGDP
jgi:hypothetical protein